MPSDFLKLWDVTVAFLEDTWGHLKVWRAAPTCTSSSGASLGAAWPSSLSCNFKMWVFPRSDC